MKDREELLKEIALMLERQDMLSNQTKGEPATLPDTSFLHHFPSCQRARKEFSRHTYFPQFLSH